MTTRAREAIDIAMSLTPEERAAVVDELLKSFDEPNPEITALWIAECNRRMEAYDRGEMESYSEEEVFADLDKL